jgi:hypothetical protein
MSKILEVLSKSANGQWTLFKAWVKDESESTPAKNLRAASPAMGQAFYPEKNLYTNSNKVLQTKNKIALDDMMDLVGKGGANPSDFHDFIRKAPKGSIDFGHVFDKIKGNPQLKSLVRDDKFIEGLNHHLDGIRNVKDIHDHHGGLDAVEGVLKHYHGSNGNPSFYSGLSLGKNNIKLHAEMMDLVNPGKGEFEYYDETDPKDRPDYSKHIDPSLHKEALDHYDKWSKSYDETDEPFDGDAERHMKAHGRAVIARGMDAFKKYHNL